MGMKEFPRGDHRCVLRHGAGVYVFQDPSDYNQRCAHVTIFKFYYIKL